MIEDDPDQKFVELNRTFHELSDYARESDDVDLGQAFHIGEPLSWSDLIKEYRTILLSEAGSGKTAEIRNVARKLREEGKPAFFIRLENIPSDFDDSFEVGSFDQFQDWLSSTEDGWLFLDSVDEARLRNPGDFHHAVRKLGRKISVAKDRAHIIVTGRISAWRPKTDLSYCTQHLPFTPVETSIEATETDADDDWEEDKSVRSKESPQPQSKAFKLVALDDLSTKQISIFVGAKRVTDTTAFLHAVERADALSFTSRPQDLEELAEFWIDQGKIGSRLELMQNSIRRRLLERDQNRADAQPLSEQYARLGAKLLAAATTLAHDPTIRVPDGADNSKGVSARDVLPEWDDKKHSVLLSRPIFDEAIYGTVRFHHRSVREYLTAEWLSELLNRDTSRRKTEALLFRNQYGLEVVVPTMRPVLPWLAILDEKIRDRLQKITPEVLFEGGDPSQFPLETRRTILEDVCEQLSEGISGRSVADRDAVQRFANADMSEDIRQLLEKYESDDELTAFLLRMVWLGELKTLLPEAKRIALTQDVSKYTRIAAFRAVKAIGSEQDNQDIRDAFVREASELKRDWLAELIQDTKPSLATLEWVFDGLSKSAEPKRYNVDRLDKAVETFASTADIDLLPKIIGGFDKLLNQEPVIERRYCEISTRFSWLLNAAAETAERLVLERHPTALETMTLDILHKLPTARDYDIGNFRGRELEFEKLVPAWPELNRALFWFEVERARAARDKKRGEPLDEFWQARFYRSYWNFDENDFDYAVEEISRQTLGDNRLVALSLAFSLYVDYGRSPKWRERLKKAVAQDAESSDRLGNYLNPPPQNEETRKWKQREANWKRRSAARKKKEKKYHEDNRKYLIENVEKLRDPEFEQPDSISDAQHYLHERAREKDSGLNRWTDGDWQCLIEEFGEAVAQAYRDGAVAYWRRYKPKLHSEGALLNSTPFSIIFGLTGLAIEARESANWFETLSGDDIVLACRYAAHELNGFPVWFPKLGEKHPGIVGNFLLNEIRYELSNEKADVDTHYIISDLSWSGEWIWDSIAPHLIDFLKANEPVNLNNLRKLLTIVQGSSVSDEEIRSLAADKCKSVEHLDHLALWFAVWTGVEPSVAIAAVGDRIAATSTETERVTFAMNYITNLQGGRRNETAGARPAFRSPSHLKSLYLLMHQHIRRDEDIERAGTGVYSPGLRDHAQEARNGLFSQLNDIPGKEAFLALDEIAKLHPDESARPWMTHLTRSKAEQDADITPWKAAQLREFHDDLERTPANHRELAGLAVMRLLDLKDDLEHGDSSIADILKNVTLETDMRKYIGRELREKANGRYSIPQEEELADAKRPDLRFQGAGFDGPVPCELKLADNGWSGAKLFERLENQLCGDYLRDNRSSRGIFALVYRGHQQGWDVPNLKKRVDFSGLVEALQSHWEEISAKFPRVDAITVIGIDLTLRAGKRK